MRTSKKKKGRGVELSNDPISTQNTRLKKEKAPGGGKENT